MRVLLFLSLLALLAYATATPLDLNPIVDLINNNNVGWKAHVNPRFNQTTIEEAKRLMGALKTPGSRKLPVKHGLIGVESIPSDFDARNAWPNCSSIGEVRDQSSCGSCWAFGATEAATDRLCIQAGLNLHLSAEDLLGCCSMCGNGCDGGYPESAWEWFTSTGCVTGGNYGDFSWCSSYSLPQCDHHVSGKYGPCPSQEYNTPSCPASCDKNTTYNTPYGQDKHKFKSAYAVNSNQNDIMAEIFNHGPVEGAFDVYEDFLAYKTGVYKHVSGGFLGGHAIKILGWGVDSGSPYWLVANSWNTDWGDQGFFKIARGSDECGIEDGVVAGLA